MKRFVLLLAILGMAAACGEDKQPLAPAAITLSGDVFDVSQAGETITLTVTAPSRPYVTACPAWIRTEAVGVYADYQLEISLAVQANHAYESRTETVTVQAGSLSRTVTVTQAGREKSDTSIGESAADAVRKMGAGWNLGNSLGAACHHAGTLPHVQGSRLQRHPHPGDLVSAHGEHPAPVGG